MSRPPSIDATSVFTPPKIFGETREGAVRADLGDVASVILLACEIADGTPRRATIVSLNETRAIAKLAADVWASAFETLTEEEARALFTRIRNTYNRRKL